MKVAPVISRNIRLRDWNNFDMAMERAWQSKLDQKEMNGV